MNFETFLNKVVNVKNLPLYGEASHAKMSPPYRKALAKQMKDKCKFAKKSAVSILFYPNDNNETYFVLILRKTYKGVHSAQVGFPGGKFEEQDASLNTTAIRETEEEIGIPKETIKVLKAMSPLYIPPSNFMVHPYLSIVDSTPNFIKQDSEVEAIIEVSLSDFLDKKNCVRTKVPTSFGIELEVPAYHLNQHIVWGATAMMLSELKDLLNEVL